MVQGCLSFCSQQGRNSSGYYIKTVSSSVGYDRKIIKNSESCLREKIKLKSPCSHNR